MRTLRNLGCAALLILFGAAGTTWAQSPNSCGCYRDDAGTCRCQKKSKCGCPEECEPVGCAEKREKQAEREANAELKRIAARERKRADEAKAVKKSRPRPAKVPLDRAAEAAKREL